MSLEAIIAQTRETTILTHYNAAISELKSMVEKDPFRITFTLSSGCVTEAMTNQLCYRFNEQGVKAIVLEGGMMSKLSILVTCPLAYDKYDSV